VGEVVFTVTATEAEKHIEVFDHLVEQVVFNQLVPINTPRDVIATSQGGEGDVRVRKRYSEHGNWELQSEHEYPRKRGPNEKDNINVPGRPARSNAANARSGGQKGGAPADAMEPKL
jgi:hypothetical protein